jgi:hypothetical protein
MAVRIQKSLRGDMIQRRDKDRLATSCRIAFIKEVA